MDKSRKQRAPIRASITKTIREVEAELLKVPPDQHELKLRLAKLDTLLEQVAQIDEAILNAMLDAGESEADYQTEYEHNEGYQDNIRAAKAKVEAAIIPQRARTVSPASSYHSASTAGGSEKKRSYKLPKIQLKQFNGDLKEWLGWWNQFKKIDEDDDLHQSDKLQYLAQSMVPNTRASDLVNSYPHTTENYPKVIRALKERFGKEKILMQVYVRELLKLVINNNTIKTKIPISTMYDKLESHLRALDSLGVTSDQTAVFLFPMVESSLPEDILVAWQRSPYSGRDGATEYPPKSELDFLMEFLRKEVENESQRQLVQSGFTEQPQKQSQQKRRHKSEEEIPTAAGLFTGHGQVAKSSCIFCDHPHESRECGRAPNLTFEEKRKKIEIKKVCFLCLKPGHPAKNCKSYVKCVLCSKRHQTVMCPEIKIKTTDKKPEKQSKPETTSTVASNFSCTEDVLMNTLLVRIVGPSQKTQVARLVFDNGSQRTSILRSTAKSLNLKASGQESLRKSLFGGILTELCHHTRYKFSLQGLDRKSSLEVEALDETVLCGRIPRVPIGPWIQELARRRIRLTDFESENPEIEVLVGSDYYGKMLTGRVVQLQGGLTAIETILGWSLSGKVSNKETDSIVSMSMMISQPSITELWDLETLGIRDLGEYKSKTEGEQQMKSDFMKTVTRKGDGRYCVRLPWKNGTLNIPNNLTVATKRLESATRKLQGSGEYLNYDQMFSSWLNEGIIERVAENEIDKPAHYLPHRPVFKPGSLTTPVRPVFDASCKTGRAPSLNDCLEKGPNLMELIPSVLLRFRERRVGVIADIRKAFLMIELEKSEQDYLRFLWWEEPFQKQVIYRHCRVVFGVNSSPFILAAVLENHLLSFTDGKQHTAKKLLSSLYVDNCVTSVATIKEYEEFKEEATNIMQDAKMELRQWERNMETSEMESNCNLNEESMTMVLGLRWDKENDTLGCNLSDMDMPVKLTKRVVLSCCQKIFDPIGFTCPATLLPKKLLQESWEKKIGWDSELPDSIKTRFMTWYEEIKYLKELKIPRWMGQDHTIESQLHVYSDASAGAYATVIFLRTASKNKVELQLVQAKSRVAPIKKMTIPRLELMGCNIAARLCDSIRKVSLADARTIYWTDSTTALSWIQSNDEWGTFVGNRVKNIISLSKPEEWRHVPGQMNPADLPSRGCDPKQLLRSKWWEGPTWLREPEEKWPTREFDIDEKAVSAEKRKSTIATMIGTASETPWYAKQFSTYWENVRVVAWIRRFTRNCKLLKVDRQKGQLSVQEFEEAENCIIQLIQKEVYAGAGDTISGLQVERGDNGIIHVRTKLLLTSEPESFRKPILLPKTHPMVDQLIRHEHTFNCHAGVQFLLSHLREKLWIVQGRRAIQKVIGKCVTCRRFAAKKVEVPRGPLPKDRVSLCKAFEVTGVDLAGPLYLKDKSKAWIVLYTCAVYRGVHLELASAQSTEAFLLSFQRFIARRGRPSTIYSDNGRNFVGASNYFAALDWKAIEKEAGINRIQWKFNPPSAAWWGGWWERLVGIMKEILKRVLGRQRLNYEQLSTITCEAEAIINNRPLIFVTEKVDDLIPLTPAMFLQDNTITNCPDVHITGDDLREKSQGMKRLRDQLWSRFRKEYLSQLVQRGKDKKTAELKVGDLVLVGDDNRKRLDWPMARILEVYPGKDGHTRVAKVQTSTGTLVRPYQRLYPLEISSHQDMLPNSNEIAEKQKSCLDHNEPKTERASHKTNKEVQMQTKSGRSIKKPERYGFNE